VSRDRELWFTVALEAALFFSLPTWALSDGGWPGNGLLSFVPAVFIGSSIALVLCHIVPATSVSILSELLPSRVSRGVELIVAGWFGIGAAASLGQTAPRAGSFGTHV